MGRSNKEESAQGTEVTLQLERKGGEEGNPKPGAAAFTDSLHSLSGGAGGQFEVVLQRREEQVVVRVLCALCGTVLLLGSVCGTGKACLADAALCGRE
eukprot:2977664-Rhodomonas_salina.1